MMSLDVSFVALGVCVVAGVVSFIFTSPSLSSTPPHRSQFAALYRKTIIHVHVIRDSVFMKIR